LTGKHKIFNIAVAAKFSTNAKIKYTELYLIQGGPKKVHFSTHHIFGTVQDKMKGISPKWPTL